MNPHDQAGTPMEIHMSTPAATSEATRHNDRPDHDHDHDHDARPNFVYEVDTTAYHHERPTITGAEIMTAAGIPTTDGLVQIMADGTTVTVSPHDVVHLVPGSQFKRRPRFKRG